jgi:hypothetical protein
MIFPLSTAMFVWFVLLVYVLPASVLSIVAGGLTCLVLRQHWGVKAAAVDATFASVVMFVAMFALGVIYAARNLHATPELPRLGLTISTLCVVVKHLLTRLSSN